MNAAARRLADGTAATADRDQAALEARAVVRRYGETLALDELSLVVPHGELYGLVGPDGAGKTTAMRAFAGMIGVDSGSVRVMGLDPLRGGKAVRNAIGYMPQQYSLYGDLSVEENLRFFSRMFCLSRAEYKERRERLLGITRLARFAERRADALSGGMYKKLALACALLPRPRLLLLDEPTNGVDPVSRRELWTLLFELAREQMAIVVSTAYMDEAARCHRVGVIDRGKLLLEGRPSALLEGLDDPALEIDAGARTVAEVEAVLEARPEVVAASVAGQRLRLVVRAEGLPRLREVLEAEELVWRRTRPDFEDLFLARTAEGRRVAAAPGGAEGGARA